MDESENTTEQDLPDNARVGNQGSRGNNSQKRGGSKDSNQNMLESLTKTTKPYDGFRQYCLIAIGAILNV